MYTKSMFSVLIVLFFGILFSGCDNDKINTGLKEKANNFLPVGSAHQIPLNIVAKTKSDKGFIIERGNRVEVRSHNFETGMSEVMYLSSQQRDTTSRDSCFDEILDSLWQMTSQNRPTWFRENDESFHDYPRFSQNGTTYTLGLSELGSIKYMVGPVCPDSTILVLSTKDLLMYEKHNRTVKKRIEKLTRSFINSLKENNIEIKDKNKK